MTITVITGANKGLGYETARRLIERGHHVVIGSRDVERGRAAASDLGRGARFVRLDVTSDSSVDAAIADTRPNRRTFGPRPGRGAGCCGAPRALRVHARRSAVEPSLRYRAWSPRSAPTSTRRTSAAALLPGPRTSAPSSPRRPDPRSRTEDTSVARRQVRALVIQVPRANPSHRSRRELHLVRVLVGAGCLDLRRSMGEQGIAATTRRQNHSSPP